MVPPSSTDRPTLSFHNQLVYWKPFLLVGLQSLGEGFYVIYTTKPRVVEITEPSCTKAQKLYRGLQVGCHLQNRMQLIRQCSKSTLFANTVNSEICGRITMLVYYIVDLACILQVTTNLQSSVHFLEQTLAKGQKYAPPRRRINHGFCSLEQKLYGGRCGITLALFSYWSDCDSHGTR